MTTPAASTPRPWFKRWWVWVLAAAIVLVLISAIANALSPRSEPAADSPSAESSAPAAPSPTPTVDAATEAPGPSEAEANEAAFSDLQTQFGGVTPAEVFASDQTLWYGWIAGTRVEGSNFFVTLQVGPGDAERRDLGERAAAAIPTLLTDEAKAPLSWVIVEDAAGTVIDQKML